ncbi:Tyrosine recombinase XerD [Nocardia otitidiscaviarum]|uniref:Tyrosine recombinase XerD n=1 Tax=Nocardia otitidiscaviarum TaxID=1823 RepID=A0A379JLI1_9NOCA|nr:site-specific integrase [Nocardia otitidiscaviarum]SUD49509.1 Tyrosine recombinase XerD [Nocardia otitidiscaviarum]
MHEAIVDALGQHHPYARHIDTFLSDLRNEGKATNTLTAYRKDLIAFAAHTDGEIGELDVEPVRAFLSEQAELAASTRARRRASVSAFCRWAYRHDLITANPVDKTNPVSVPKGLPRPAATRDVARLLNAICSRRPARTVPLDVIRTGSCSNWSTSPGARISEACGVHVEDLDLRVDDEHVACTAKEARSAPLCSTTAIRRAAAPLPPIARATPPALCSAPASTEPAAR